MWLEPGALRAPACGPGRWPREDYYVYYYNNILLVLLLLVLWLGAKCCVYIYIYIYIYTTNMHIHVRHDWGSRIPETLISFTSTSPLTVQISQAQAHLSRLNFWKFAVGYPYRCRSKVYDHVTYYIIVNYIINYIHMHTPRLRPHLSRWRPPRRPSPRSSAGYTWAGRPLLLLLLLLLVS